MSTYLTPYTFIPFPVTSSANVGGVSGTVLHIQGMNYMTDPSQPNYYLITAHAWLDMQDYADNFLTKTINGVECKCSVVTLNAPLQLDRDANGQVTLLVDAFKTDAQKQQAQDDCFVNQTLSESDYRKIMNHGLLFAKVSAPLNIQLP